MVGFQHYLVRLDTICLWIRCGIRNDTKVLGLKKIMNVLYREDFVRSRLRVGRLGAILNS